MCETKSSEVVIGEREMVGFSLLRRFRSPFLPGIVPGVLALTLLSVFVTGYRSLAGNQAIQIPLVHLINDPSLYPGDPLRGHTAGLPSSVWLPVAWIARVMPLEAALALVFLLERYLLMLGVGVATRAVLPGSRLAPLAAMAAFALGPLPPLGGGTLVLDYFEQTGSAIVCFLFALAAFQGGRPWMWMLAMAAACYANIMYTAYAASYFVGAFAVDRERRRHWAVWLGAAAGAMVLSAPMLVWAARAMGAPAVDKTVWIRICEIRLPHHMFPLTWDASLYLRHAALSGWTLFALLMARDRGMARTAGAFFAVGCAWLALAFVTAYWLQVPALFVLHPARGLDFWYAFCGVALAAVLARDVERHGVRRLAVLGAFYALWLPTTLVVTVCVALAAWALAAARWVGRRWPEPAGVSAVVLVVFLVLCGISLSLGRFRRDGFAVLGTDMNAEQADIARWARQSTDRDAAFLIQPEEWPLFRGVSKRPVFYEWKDGSAILWSRPFAAVWNERAQALGFSIFEDFRGKSAAKQRLERLYRALGDEDAAQLAGLFGLRYWVVPDWRESRFPAAYTSGRYKVLDLQAN